MRVRYKNYERKGTLIDGYRVVDHPLYYTFMQMHSRCFNEEDSSYHNYGDRGITVCDRWDYFSNFVADMGPKPDPELTIERVNNDLGYSPENCVWATRSDQCVNRRTFKNSSTGLTGVLDHGYSYEARFDYEGERYRIGRFETAEEAAVARARFVDLFFTDKKEALALIPEEVVWRNSTTNVRGVTPHVDGGFIVRKTINGKRTYLGYFKTIEEAVRAKQG